MQNVNFSAPCPYSSKLLLLLNFFPCRVFSFCHSVAQHRSVYDRCYATWTTQILNLQWLSTQYSALKYSTTKWFTIDQIGEKLDGTLQDISVYLHLRSFDPFPPLSSGRALYLIGLTHSEKAEIVNMTLTAQLQGLRSPERGHCTAPSRDRVIPGGVKFSLSSIHNRVGGSQMGTLNQTVVFLGTWPWGPAIR